MPELPEVETIRLSLEKLIIGLSITRIDIFEKRLRWPVAEINLQKALGHKIDHVARRAKYLILTLDDKANIIIHLGMTGRLFVVSDALAPDKHDHLIFHFDNNDQLRYHDPRKFGMVDYVAPGALSEYHHFRFLGPEPLSRGFSLDYFLDRATDSRRSIKHFIMDSQVVVGVGNIYANEALFVAQIHPLRRTGDLTAEELERVRTAIQAVLSSAVQEGGTTLRDSQYRDARGEIGYFQYQLCVYDRVGEPCKTCTTPIQKLRMTNRSSFFCPKCQSIA